MRGVFRRRPAVPMLSRQVADRGGRMDAGANSGEVAGLEGAMRDVLSHPGGSSTPHLRLICKTSASINHTVT